MYNLLVKYGGWAEGNDSMSMSRVLEYTEKNIIDQFRPNGQLDLQALCQLPSLFLAESGWDGNQIARVGTITQAQIVGREIVLDYMFDPSIRGIPNSTLEQSTALYRIAKFEFSRTHWAIINTDLFRAILRHKQPQRQKPIVFHIAEHENVEPQLVSAMMPFAPQFNAVYETLQAAAEERNLRCRRADDIWENPAVMQDVVNLIDRSRVVIADCTGRNPNVFYEIGIAHTLGREVILITQAEADIPFDLRHLRYVTYLPNDEGLRSLAAQLTPRLEAVT